MKYVMTAVLVLMSGCAMELPAGEPMDQAVVEAALAEWQGRGLPMGSCVAEKESLRIAVGNAAEVCNVDPKYRPAGCYFGAPDLLIVVEASIANTTEYDISIQHELRHWLGECSGLGLDSDHQDGQLWYGDVL
jgi:hypothetical protein